MSISSEARDMTVANWMGTPQLVKFRLGKKITTSILILCILTALCMICIAVLSFLAGLFGLGVLLATLALIFGYLSILSFRGFSIGIASGEFACSLCVISLCIVLLMIWVNILPFVFSKTFFQSIHPNIAYKNHFETYICHSASSLTYIPSSCILIFLCLGLLFTLSTIFSLMTCILTLTAIFKIIKLRNSEKGHLLAPQPPDYGEPSLLEDWVFKFNSIWNITYKCYFLALENSKKTIRKLNLQISLKKALFWLRSFKSFFWMYC